MEYDIELTELKDQTAAVVHGEVPVDAIGPFVGQALEKVMAALSQAGAFPVGPPFARFDMHEDTFVVDAGFPCGGSALDGGDVRMTHLPAGLAAQTTHIGSYRAVAGAYGALEEWIREHGYQPAGMPWETYLDGPEVMNPRTIITWPIEGRG